MHYSLTIPARINILGNPADANEGAHATISAAINIWAGAFVEDAEELTLEQLARDEDGNFKVARSWQGKPEEMVYDGYLDLMKAAMKRILDYSTELREKLSRRRVKIGLWTEVPRNSGLGGSSLLILLMLGGLRTFYDLDLKKHHDYVLAEITQRIEAKELGITCGFADRYVPLFGGLAYVDYRDKLYHKPLGEEPYATYERLDDYVDDLPLIVASTGVQRESGDVHGAMRPRYLQEYIQYEENPRQVPFLVKIMADIGATAWQGKIALLAGDLERFGTLMNENHRLVNQMMEYCGFRDGAGWANNLFIQTALESGALGAKLTGAGGGGSVFALTSPGEQSRVIEALRSVAQEHHLDQAQIYQVEVSRQGLRVTRES
jgi:galactokinase/mevalonate kinase-like predicted kinase